ncbi:hypothetical protein [Paenibacillus caui]|uniref:hypothetical protein n=1 Tax=Paenibacillus caui TaxID=2873927 RepID=UPI001CA9A3FB|nr:hypothetical protein [Paenibacillus caui]
MTKLPQNVQTAVDAYRAEHIKFDELAAAHRGALDKLNGDLAAAKAELAAASAATLTKPTPASIEAEVQLARKVKEIDEGITAQQGRLSVALTSQSSQLTQLADAAINAGRAEAHRYFIENRDAKLATIEDAKYAYLSALVDLHNMRKNARDIYNDAVSQTNANRAEYLSKPYFEDTALFYRGGARQVHGISETEIMRAYKHGQILKTSVAAGRKV